MESPFLPPVSADLFWCLVFDVLLVSSALRLCGAHHASMARLASGFQGSRKSEGEIYGDVRLNNSIA